MQPYATVIDITDQIPGLSGTLLMSAWIFAPHEYAKGIVFCLDSKATFHLVVPGYPADAYSLASFLAQQGWLVIALDSLGMGESTSLEQDALTMEMLASANEAAFQQILMRILEDDLNFIVPRMEYPSVTMCIGYGKGAMLAIAQQAQYRRYDALVVAGWSNYQWSLGGCEGVLARALGMEEASCKLLREAGKLENFLIASSALRPFLYAEDVPSAVMSANEGHVHDVLRSLARSPDYGLMQKVAALIDVPLFLCLAEKDVADNLQAEATRYPWSPHVETFLLRGSAHLHHVASNRQSLWTRLDRWFHQILEQCVERKTEIHGE